MGVDIRALLEVEDHPEYINILVTHDNWAWVAEETGYSVRDVEMAYLDAIQRSAPCYIQKRVT